MHVLITRPVQDAEPLKSRLEALGCEVSLAPLIEIATKTIAVDALAGATAFIATSRNALAALKASPALPAVIELPLYVVGPGTAAVARETGFRHVIEGLGRAEDLVPLLASQRDRNDRLIYLMGDVLAFDLEAKLIESGLHVVPVPAYQSIAAETLPAVVIKALQKGDIDAVMLMSPRTAAIWERLTAALSPPVQPSGVTYLCLSERVGEALGQAAKAAKVLVPSHPSAEEMLALVKRLAASSKAE